MSDGLQTRKLLPGASNRVLLVGNYAPERQQSMLRFGQMLLGGLTARGIEAEMIQPPVVFGRVASAGSSVAKMLGYLDKFILFPIRLKAKLRSRRPAIVHICDHSYAMYARGISATPVVVTCHDLLAVRGGMGEETDCPASSTGKILQRWIVSGLRRAAAVACVSRTTFEDARRIIGGHKLRTIALGLSYPYRQLSAQEAQTRLAATSMFSREPKYVLHVGSNLRRKNREGVMRIFALAATRWEGQLVIAGEPLSVALRQLACDLGISDRILEIVSPTNELLEALYSSATALLFPSRFEGFGWPIIEAQACGCPVLTSATSPMAEVAGGGALLRDPADEQGFADDLLSLGNESSREYWGAKALENAKRFTTERMISEYCELYRSLVAAC